MQHQNHTVRCTVTLRSMWLLYFIPTLFFSDRSENEKNRIRLAYAHVLVALDQLASKYAALLLGTDLKNFHHMRNGE